MKDVELADLIDRIHAELDDLQRVLARIHNGWKRARVSNEDYYIDSVALNLHGFYSGFEHIFVRIAEIVDGDLPRGENWHQLLLQQMTREVKEIRPAVISTEIGEALDELRRFRHIVRNVYTHNFDPAKVKILVLSVENIFQNIKEELVAFIAFLEQG